MTANSQAPLVNARPSASCGPSSTVISIVGCSTPKLPYSRGRYSGASVVMHPSLRVPRSSAPGARAPLCRSSAAASTRRASASTPRPASVSETPWPGRRTSNCAPSRRSKSCIPPEIAAWETHSASAAAVIEPRSATATR